MEYESCEFCKFEKCNSEEYPCRICKHAYDNMFVKKNSKTRQSEFLRHYPNANIEEVMEILPCTIDKYLFVENRTTGECERLKEKGYLSCFECMKKYWPTEIEE